MAKTLLISSYHTFSHRYWCQQIEQLLASDDITLLQLPPRHVAWRLRGSPLSLEAKFDDLLARPYDRLIATSMLDLAGLRSLYPQLTTIPNHLYFHENQFAYPGRQQPAHLIDLQLATIYAARSASTIRFNSTYNQQSFLSGVDQFIRKMPDERPRHLIDHLRQKSAVLPVPLADTTFAERSNRPAASDTLQLLWNHRWEYDKGPERLYQVLAALDRSSVPWRIAVIGPRFRQIPEAFTAIRDRWPHKLSHWGYIEERQEYERIVRHSHVVLSTAHHDFQGLAVLEAAAAGATPLVPERLVYPETFPTTYLYSSDPDPEAEAKAIRTKLEQWWSCWPAWRPEQLAGFRQSRLRADYHRWLHLASTDKR